MLLKWLIPVLPLLGGNIAKLPLLSKHTTNCLKLSIELAHLVHVSLKLNWKLIRVIQIQRPALLEFKLVEILTES